MAFLLFGGVNEHMDGYVTITKGRFVRDGRVLTYPRARDAEGNEVSMLHDGPPDERDERLLSQLHAELWEKLPLA